MIFALMVAAVASGLADRPAEIVGPQAGQPDYRQMLTEAAIAAESHFSLHAPCTTATVRDRSTKVFDVKNPSSLYIPKMAFESVTVSGCGRTTAVNLEVMSRRDGHGWALKQRLPGDSHADFDLQNAAMVDILSDLQSALPPACPRPTIGKDMQVGATQIYVSEGDAHFVRPGEKLLLPKLNRPGYSIVLTVADPALLKDINAPLAWTEIWPLTACGTDRSFTVTFAPLRSRPDHFQIFTSRHWPGTYQVPGK